MGQVIAANDVVITTAAVPGKKAPILITAEMVRGMAPGSVIVDLAAERGGNCELTQPGTNVDVDGVTVMGPENIPATVPYHASQMYAKNVANLIVHLTKEGKIEFDREDEIVRETTVTNITSRPSESCSANQSQPTWSSANAEVLHSRSIQLFPSTLKDCWPMLRVPVVGMRVIE